MKGPAMNDTWIVIIGVVSVLACVSLVSWLARPSEFRSHAEFAVGALAPRPNDERVLPVSNGTHSCQLMAMNAADTPNSVLSGQ